MSICAGRDVKKTQLFPQAIIMMSLKIFCTKIDPKTAKIGIIMNFRNDSIDPGGPACA